VQAFEDRVASVVAAAERAATLLVDSTTVVPSVEVPATTGGSPADVLATTLGLEPDELDLVWSVVARAVEPRVGKTIDRDLLRRAGRGEYRAMGHVLGRDHRNPDRL
jgi:hypothetical protein